MSPSAKGFVHREHHLSDPAFLRDERQFLERQWGVLHVMERDRDHLLRDIERCRSLAKRAGIPLQSEEPGADKLLALIGIGNRYRRDDAAGLEVARRLRKAHPPGVKFFEEEGEPATLIETWSEVEEALVVDAVSSGARPGTLHRFDPIAEPLPLEFFRSSTHVMGIAEAVELARELNRLPGRLVVYGIEGESFDAGEGLTPAVQDAVAALVMDLYAELSGAS
jgi:hydrogenase maturation protease